MVTFKTKKCLIIFKDNLSLQVVVGEEECSLRDHWCEDHGPAGG